jgi:hypothetical protein
VFIPVSENETSLTPTGFSTLPLTSDIILHESWQNTDNNKLESEYTDKEDADIELILGTMASLIVTEDELI